MKIIILGAGRVGSSVATNLAHEANDVTLVDTNPEVLNKVQEHLDIATICGNAAYPDTLLQAGANRADILLALTHHDETNMIACQVAHHLFGARKKLARIRTDAFLDARDTLFSANAIPIDFVINPEEGVTRFITDLIQHPGTHQVLSFANGLLRLVECRAKSDSPLIGQSLIDMDDRLDGIPARAAAIYRQSRLFIPKRHTVIEPDDRIFFIAPSKVINTVVSRLLEIDKPYKRLMIVGGGRIGFSLAKSLEHEMKVKVIEKNPERAREIAEQLDNAIVLTGDASSEDLLMDENIERTDVFCTVTCDDEVNILTAMLAKRLGVRKVMSLVDRPAYMDMIDSGLIDNAIFPQHITIGQVLAHVRHGHFSHVYSLLRGAAEALEAIAYNSELVGRRIDQIRMPRGAGIIGVVREMEPLKARSSLVIERGDRVIVLVTDKRSIPAVEMLFQNEDPVKISAAN